jgi:hypothetical protein
MHCDVPRRATVDHHYGRFRVGYVSATCAAREIVRLLVAYLANGYCPSQNA